MIRQCDRLPPSAFPFANAPNQMRYQYAYTKHSMNDQQCSALSCHPSSA